MANEEFQQQLKSMMAVQRELQESDLKRSQQIDELKDQVSAVAETLQSFTVQVTSAMTGLTEQMAATDQRMVATDRRINLLIDVAAHHHERVMKLEEQNPS